MYTKDMSLCWVMSSTAVLQCENCQLTFRRRMAVLLAYDIV